MEIGSQRGRRTGTGAANGQGRPLRVLGALLLLVALVGSVVGRSAGAAVQRDDPEALDLAALTLLPSDLASPRYRLGSSYAVTIEDQAQSAADYRGGGDRERDDYLDALRDAGYRQGYSSSLFRPITEGSFEGDVVVVSYVFAYADAAGAADGFALLEDESDVPSAEDLPDPPDLGDEVELTRDEGETSEGDAFQALDLTFRIGELVAGVVIYDYTGREPRPGALGLLGETLAERVEAGLDGREPRGAGLGAAALRFAAGPDVFFPYAYEAYQRLDGETVPLVGQTEDDFASLDRFYADATDVYAVRYEIEAAGLDAEAIPYYSADLRRYADEAAAADWMAAEVAAWEEGPGGYESMAPVTDATALGDESATFAYEYLTPDGDRVLGYLIYARVGEIVASVQLDAFPEPPLAAAEEIAALQVDCLEAGACPVEVPVPASLTALTTDEGTPAADETAAADATAEAGDENVPDKTIDIDEIAEADETPEPEATEEPEDEDTPEEADDLGVDGNTYVSPTFGWSIAWDERFWGVEDVRSAAGVDVLQLGDPDINTVRFIAAPDFAGDPETCLDNIVGGLRDAPDVEDVERLRGEDGDIIAGEEDDRAFAAYTYTVVDEDGDFPVSQYVECRTLVPGEAVLAIVYIVAASEFAGQFPLVEDLLAAVEIPGADQTPEAEETAEPTPDSDATPEPEEATPTVAAGGTYVSPTFEYRLAFDESWAIQEESSEDGVDRLTLGNGASTVVFLAAADEEGGDAAACLERATAELESDPAVGEIAPILEDGEPVAETAADRTFAASTYTFTNERGQEVRLARYTECRTLVPGEATLLITQTTLAETYDDQVEAVAALLEGLEIPRGGGLIITLGTPSAAGTPEADDGS